MNRINRAIAGLLPLVPKAVVWQIAKRYIPGEHLEDAVGAIQALNRKGISATLDYLGETPKEKSESLDALDVYKKALDEIARHGLDCGISVKLSHMGLKLDREFCEANMTALLSHAEKTGAFVRIDMEEAALRPATLEIHHQLEKNFQRVGTVLQAYLRCAHQDAGEFTRRESDIRLCKGAYFWEEPDIVFKDAGEIRDNYFSLAKTLIQGGCRTALATHDLRLIRDSTLFIRENNIPEARFEFQMLYGVQEKLRDRILAEGFPVRVYVPFGTQWLAYCLRRLRENPDMVRHILSAAMPGPFHLH